MAIKIESGEQLANSNPSSRRRSIFGVLDDLVSVVDAAYRYVTVSSGYERFFGIPSGQIIGRHVWEIHGEARFEEQIKPFLDRTLAGEEVQLQFWGRNHLGELRYLDSRHTPYQGHLTDSPAVAVVARDLTEMARVQAELERERHLLGTLIEAIPDFVFTKNLEGVYQQCNASFEEFLGMSKQQILGKTDFQIMSRQSADYIAGKDGEVKSSGQAVRVDEWVDYQDGRRRLLDMYKLPLHDEHGAVCGIIGIGRNVTHERKAEQKLLLSALVFDSISDACLILSRSGEVESCNRAARERIPGLAGSLEQRAQFTDYLYSPCDCSRDIVQSLANEEQWHGELCTGDHRHFIATLNPAPGIGDEGARFVLILRDHAITDALEAELHTRAYSDNLTGLPNRLLFMSRLQAALVRAERQRSQIAVLFIDLDNFKQVNDRFGHAEGDRLLAEVAKRMGQQVRQTDTLARLGGDEFVAFIDITDQKQAAVVARKIAGSVTSGLTAGPGQEPAMVGASIGISIFPGDSGEADELLLMADKAMYQAKSTPTEAFSFASSKRN